MFACRAYPPNAKDCGDYPLLSCHSEESEDALSSWPSSSPGRSRRAASLGGVGVGGASSSAGDADAQAFATPLGTWSVGKLSVLLLAFATIVDFALCHVQSMEHPEFYDALSADVIRPAFRYHHSSSSSGSSRPRRTSLGSAAISSVTEALSPILPFAGGLDLRKQDYWMSSGNFFETLQDVAATVQEAFRSKSSWSSATSVVETPRGGGNVPGKLAAQLKRKPTQHVTAISSADPFVSLATISEMTLSDVTETFRYAVECNKEGFNEARFVSNLAPRVRTVVAAISEAMAKSRGRDAKISRSAGTPTAAAAGEVDALAFSAAMRIFAEWRMLRQVPEGYKGFAMGMSLGHKDVVQNLAKIEQGAHDWLNRQRDVLALQAQWDGTGDSDKCPIDGSQPQVLRSPTLKEILGYEVEMDINPASRLPRLKDKSASMGVLWVRRQLHYQTLLFDNAMKIPSKFGSTAEAVLAAYKSVYDQYHGWAVQKIFNYSFQAAPEAEEIFKHMNPHKFKEVLASARKVQANSSPADGHTPLNQETDDNPFTSFFKHVGGEWDKLVSNVGQVFGQGKESSVDLMVRGGGSAGASASALNQESDALVTKEMVKDAHEHISNYLKVVYPLLDDLAILFDDMNMDDPTRV
jgi:Glycolipid transfer protein (GLTP)